MFLALKTAWTGSTATILELDNTDTDVDWLEASPIHVGVSIQPFVVALLLCLMRKNNQIALTYMIFGKKYGNILL